LTPWEQRVFCCLEDIVPHGKQTIEARGIVLANVKQFKT
jgi:hypothetical protein